ncbi:MAG: magnesium chelatase subunit H [Chlorobium phaeobacteroides]|nr:magnesium chelatase subunit H [Chlorobium phaeobacteroides]
MRFLFLTMESTNNRALKNAAAVLNQEYDCRLEVMIFNLGLNKEDEVWRNLQQTVSDVDFIFGSMLFSEEIVRPLEKLLSSAACPVCIITSNPALIRQTRLGRFNLLRYDDGEKKKSVFRNLAAKLKPGDKQSESHRQLSLVRNISKVLKHIPGKSRDMHTFISAHQFWLNGSDENMKHFLCLLIDRYGASFTGRLPQKDPIFYPDTALCHPDASEAFYSAALFRKWLGTRNNAEHNGQVAILAMRSTVLSKNMLHIEHLLRSLESRGLDAYIAYSGGLDFRSAINSFFGNTHEGRLSPDLIINATGFSLVGGPAENKAAEATEALKKISIPYINIVPLSFQSIQQWQSGNLGLTPLQTALSVAIPELDGAIEPHVYAGAEENSDKTIPLPAETERIAERVRKHVDLRRKAPSKKQIAIVLFNFPPNLGNAGTAAFLDVFQSLFVLMREMRQTGYDITLPESVEDLKAALLEGNRDLFGTDGNVAEHLLVDEYRRIFPKYHEIETHWGNAPGELLNDGNRFHILGKTFGNVFIGQQPGFGYERDPMRLLMAKDASPNHAFAAFYAWLEHIWKADAVVHFGTHGALEFMPGKQVGLGASCWPKRLIGSMPNFYYYCVNNPSEGAIAKRRGFATLVSYLAPPLEHAGLYKELRQLRDLIENYHQTPAQEILEEIGSLADTLDLNTDREHLPIEQYLTALNRDLYKIEERMIPLGLHVIGKNPTPENLVDQLTLLITHPVAALQNMSLPEYICKVRKRDYSQIVNQNTNGSEKEREWRDLLHISRETVRHFIGTLPGAEETQYDIRSILEASFKVRISAAEHYLHRTASIRPGHFSGLWELLQHILIAMISNREIPGMLDALGGRYIEPSPGNDLLRNHNIVPTGRNMHSLDPFSIPSLPAQKRGKQSAEELLYLYREESGCLPESIAIVLWGTDNLKSDGEGIAQALALIGARPKTDELGKVSDVELIPYDELGRARIDVVITVSGIFRDLLSHQISLLDKAVRLAAAADEPETVNFIRRNVLREAEEQGVSPEHAANRIFSNAPGSYGANVNHLVESSSWENDSELSETFINRKCFSFNAGGSWEESPEILTSALRNVTLTYQNIDSYEIGISDIDHYYEYLGGVSKSVELISHSKPKVMVGDVNGFGKNQKICSLEKMVALEARTKLLNPKWYQSMLDHGYEGVREIESHLSNTYGWSATASAVKDWTYTAFNETFLRDREMLEQLKSHNIHATLSMTRRLLEANSRGFWKTDKETIEELQELYSELENSMEGTHSVP